MMVPWPPGAGLKQTSWWWEKTTGLQYRLLYYLIQGTVAIWVRSHPGWNTAVTTKDILYWAILP